MSITKRRKHSIGCICKDCILSKAALRRPAPVPNTNVVLTAEQAIDEVFSDTSVSKETTQERLEDLLDNIETKLHTLADY